MIDPVTGRWQARDDGDEDADDRGATARVVSGLKPYVMDSRNILLLRPALESLPDEGFMKTLAHALRRAIQIAYQVEEQEIAVELIGRQQDRSLLFWEAAEGGIGVWERLANGSEEICQVAKIALELLHFQLSGEETAAWATTCTAACYDCLLSYANQPDHRHLDRHVVRDYLLSLTRCAAASHPERLGYE